MTIKDIYSREFRNELGLFPVWQPGEPISVGDFGIIEKSGIFRKEGELKSLFPRLLFDTSTRKLKKDYRFCSKDCTVGEVAASGSDTAVAAASVGVKFGARGGVIFEAIDIRRTFAEDILAVGRAVRTIAVGIFRFANPCGPNIRYIQRKRVSGIPYLKPRFTFSSIRWGHSPLNGDIGTQLSLCGIFHNLDGVRCCLSSFLRPTLSAGLQEW